MALAISSGSTLGRPGVLPAIQVPKSVLVSQPSHQPIKPSGPAPAPQPAVRTAAPSQAQPHLGGHVDVRA